MLVDAEVRATVDVTPSAHGANTAAGVAADEPVIHITRAHYELLIAAVHAQLGPLAGRVVRCLCNGGELTLRELVVAVRDAEQSSSSVGNSSSSAASAAAQQMVSSRALYEARAVGSPLLLDTAHTTNNSSSSTDAALTLSALTDVAIKEVVTRLLLHRVIAYRHVHAHSSKASSSSSSSSLLPVYRVLLGYGVLLRVLFPLVAAVARRRYGEAGEAVLQIVRLFAVLPLATAVSLVVRERAAAATTTTQQHGGGSNNDSAHDEALQAVTQAAAVRLLRDGWLQRVANNSSSSNGNTTAATAAHVGQKRERDDDDDGECATAARQHNDEADATATTTAALLQTAVCRLCVPVLLHALLREATCQLVAERYGEVDTAGPHSSVIAACMDADAAHVQRSCCHEVDNGDSNNNNNSNSGRHDSTAACVVRAGYPPRLPLCSRTGGVSLSQLPLLCNARHATQAAYVAAAQQLCSDVVAPAYGRFAAGGSAAAAAAYRSLLLCDAHANMTATATTTTFADTHDEFGLDTLDAAMRQARPTHTSPPPSLSSSSAGVYRVCYGAAVHALRLAVCERVVFTRHGVAGVRIIKLLLQLGMLEDGTLAEEAVLTQARVRDVLHAMMCDGYVVQHEIARSGGGGSGGSSTAGSARTAAAAAAAAASDRAGGRHHFYVWQCDVQRTLLPAVRVHVVQALHHALLRLAMHLGNRSNNGDNGSSGGAAAVVAAGNYAHVSSNVLGSALAQQLHNNNNNSSNNAGKVTAEAVSRVLHAQRVIVGLQSTALSLMRMLLILDYY